MNKKIILTKILNDCYIDGKKTSYKEFNKIFDDLINYKQVGFINYIVHGQLVNKWILKTTK